jgi:hypothetical protein
MFFFTLLCRTVLGIEVYLGAYILRLNSVTNTYSYPILQNCPAFPGWDEDYTRVV